MGDFLITKLVGQRLKALRLEAGLTEEEICKRLQMNAGNFSTLENGMTDIPLWRLGEIAEFFNIDVHDLLSAEGSAGVLELTENLQSFARINLLQAREITRLQHKIIELYSSLEHEYRNCKNISNII